MRSQARRYDMFIARPAAEIDPDSPTSSSSLILPGPIAPWSDRSMRMVSFAKAPGSWLPACALGSRVDSGPSTVSGQAVPGRNKSLRSAGPSDLVLRVAERAEDPVVETRPARFYGEVRVDVLPDHFPLVRHLENPAVAPLADQRVAVGQPLGARDVGTPEIEQRLVAILPHDRARPRVDLDHPRVRRGMIDSMGPVVEDQQVAVGQRTRIVLLGQWRRTELPGDRARAPIDD